MHTLVSLSLLHFLSLNFTKTFSISSHYTHSSFFWASTWHHFSLLLHSSTPSLILSCMHACMKEDSWFLIIYIYIYIWLFVEKVTVILARFTQTNQQLSRYAWSEIGFWLSRANIVVLFHPIGLYTIWFNFQTLCFWFRFVRWSWGRCADNL